MGSFTGSIECPYMTNTNTIVGSDEDDESEFPRILEIHIHHARNIHNICIYDNQDVYAKFSLTCNPDETLSTSIVVGGGRNPEFNESMAMKITQMDKVLKCEMWMLSRARNYLEDQLLGFSLIPISQIVGHGKVSRDYILSSTDLFHSPAGTVKLTLSINTDSSPSNPIIGLDNSSISSEVVLLDRKDPEVEVDLVEYTMVEFPDVDVVSENNKMVYEYFSRPELFLHLGVPPRPSVSSKEEEACAKPAKIGSQMFGEADQEAMQNQIVDIYMKSMQQFTESLAKMKLPMDLRNPDIEIPRDLMQVQDNGKADVDPKKKDGPRVFYGSRAFF